MLVDVYLRYAFDTGRLILRCSAASCSLNRVCPHIVAAVPTDR